MTDQELTTYSIVPFLLKHATNTSFILSFLAAMFRSFSSKPETIDHVLKQLRHTFILGFDIKSKRSILGNLVEKKSGVEHLLRQGIIEVQGTLTNVIFTLLLNDYRASSLDILRAIEK